jgi:hypothetical protein
MTQHRKLKKMSNTDPTINPGVNSGAREFQEVTAFFQEVTTYFQQVTAMDLLLFK